ncbi:MAG TPA: hypothetical protein VMF06_08645 [Candidatus Limnocylindria bacterium]|jgi:hypothetical protein|nr:hypothetical protein [Candidatus Limnocylindria bacterium]
MNTQEAPVLKLPVNCLKFALIFVFSVFMFIMGWVSIAAGRWIMVIFGLGFGALGIPTCLVGLLTNRMTLYLTPEGFRFGTIRKKYSYKWSEVASFGVGQVESTRVCFTLAPDFLGEERVRAINRREIGYDRFLPDLYGKSPVELANLLEEWRFRYSKNDSSN